MKYLILTILLTVTQHANAILITSGFLNFINIDDRPTPLSNAWNFTNTPDADQATLSGLQTYSSSLHGDLDFILREPVSYAIESLSLALLNEGGSFSTDIFLGDSVLLPSTHRPPLYSESISLFSEPLAAIYLSSSGIMDPGHYTFHYSSRVDGGAAAGAFNFTLSRVPEAGSTLMLLGLALGLIGIYKKSL